MPQRVRRQTRETDVSVSIELDGRGDYEVEVPHPFLRHMLESLARFARFDLRVHAQGDDVHHVVEDVGITMGRSLRERLEGRTVERTASATVPMDEALVLVSVDLIDRPYVEATFPDPLIEHFLRSFVTEAKFTCHVVVLRGRDDHHVMEAAFKALGVALRLATRPAEVLMSTKSRPRWGAKRR